MIKARINKSKEDYQIGFIYKSEHMLINCDDKLTYSYIENGIFYFTIDKLDNIGCISIEIYDFELL